MGSELKGCPSPVPPRKARLHGSGPGGPAERHTGISLKLNNW